MKEYPTQEYLKSILTYRDGMLYWKERLSSKGVVGKIAGSDVKSRHYRKIGINGKRYFTHRIIWIMLNGPIPSRMEIDHINRDHTDNRIENLRLVSRSQNSLNKNHKNIRKQGKGYLTRVTFNGILYSEYFETLCQAEEWVKKKKKELLDNY